MRAALALALLLCLWFTRTAQVSVVTPLTTRPLTEPLGPPLTADDIARGVHALSQQGRLSDEQHRTLNRMLSQALPVRRELSELQAARAESRLESSVLGARVLESK